MMTLYTACTRKSLAEATALMVGDMNREFSQGNTALFPACRRGHVGIVKAVIQNGANVNHINRAGETPLILACRQSRKGVIKALIENGANTNYADRDGESPLLIVCRRSRHEVIKVLVENGADVNYCDPINGETPLAIAVKRIMYNWGYDDNTNYLLENTCADVNKGVVEIGGDKTNVLNLLLTRGYTHNAKLHLRHGAIPDRADSKGNFPLCSALWNLESTKFFLDKFPDSAHRPVTTSGTTTLENILFGDAPVEVFREVVSRKIVDIVGGRINGKTALEWADEMDATWGDTYQYFKKILPYLYYARDEQRLTELCKVFLLVEKQRASVVPHVLEKMCNLSADIFEEQSQYLAPRDVAETPKKSGCECGYCTLHQTRKGAKDHSR